MLDKFLPTRTVLYISVRHICISLPNFRGIPNSMRMLYKSVAYSLHRLRYAGIVHILGRMRLKCDDTRAETRLRLSAQRTSPFKSRGDQFSRLVAGELCTSACRVCTARASLCSAVTWRLLATHSIRQFPFTSPPVRHRVPSHFKRSLLLLQIFIMYRSYSTDGVGHRKYLWSATYILWLQSKWLFM